MRVWMYPRSARRGRPSSIMFLPNVKSLADMLVIRLAVAYDEKGNVLAN